MPAARLRGTGSDARSGTGPTMQAACQDRCGPESGLAILILFGRDAAGLAGRGGGNAFAAASGAIGAAVAEAVAAGEATRDAGGRLGTSAAGEAVPRASGQVERFSLFLEGAAGPL